MTAQKHSIRKGKASTLPLIQPLERRTLLSSSPAIIDVMVLYTQQAAMDVGGNYAIYNRINRAIAQTNQALSNSRINATLRLVHEGWVSYSQSGVLSNDLLNLQQGQAGLGGVSALRKQYGADLVSLWVGQEIGDEAGRGFQPDSSATAQAAYGFDVVESKYAVDNFVFAHEIGHNLGGGHDHSDPSPRTIPYAYGKTFTLGSYTIGDIMSDTGNERIAYYSNPNISFRGVPTGNADNSPMAADNARVMNQFAPVIANYEPSVVKDITPPDAALEEVITNPSTQTLTVKVQYVDATAVNVSSLGTGDVVIHGPNGFAKIATYLGTDVPGNGSQRIATYQVGIAGFSADPGAYSFFLQAGRVRDTLGNVATGFKLGAPGGILPYRAGPRLATAFDQGTINGTSTRVVDWLDSNNPTAFYRFTLATAQQFTSNLSNLSVNVDELLVQDRNNDGIIEPNEILSYPRRSGTTPETISLYLAAGTYYLWVAPPVLGIGSGYSLTMSAASLPALPVVAPAQLSGLVYNDWSGDGIREKGEAGLAVWTVYLDLNNDGVLDSTDRSTKTDYWGDFTFANLAPGTYTVRVVPQTSWHMTSPSTGYARVTLTSGQTVNSVSFGEKWI